MSTIDKKGSVWKRWDLHVHTPESALEHSLGDNWDKFVEHLIDAAERHNIYAIATADYFTVEGYRELLKYYDKQNSTLSVGSKKRQLYIIPGVELRLNIFNDLEESINLHVFFDPDSCSSDFITQNFLEELKIDYRGSNNLPLKKQNLLAIGKSIMENGQANFGLDFSRLDPALGKSYIRKALATVTLRYNNIDDALKAIDEILEKQNLPPKAHLVAVVGKGHGGIRTLKWFEENKSFSRAGLVREHVTHQADIIFSNDSADRDFYLGKNKDTPPNEIEVRFSSLKPCVWGSDSRTPETLLHPSSGNTLDYAWIKSDISFEGLKQIIYEPELRVRVQQDDPHEEEIYAKIESLELNFPDDLKIKDKESNEAIPFCIQGKQKINFSSNLTCVIGGRGSGKSTLIHLLYNLVPKRDTDRLSKVNSPLFNLQLGTKDELGKVRSLTKSEIPLATEFFLQNEVEKFAKDINEMSALIRSRLYGMSNIDDAQQGLQQLENEWQSTATDIDELIDAYNQITKIDLDVASIQKQKETLKKQTDVISSKEYKDLQKEIEKIANKINAFDTYQREYKQIVLEISNLIKSVGRMDWSGYEGQNILTSLSSELEKRKTELQESFEKAKKNYDDANFTTQLSDKKTQLKKFLKEKGLSTESIGEVAIATQQISELEEQIKTLQKQRAPYQEIYNSKDSALRLYQQMYTSYRDSFKQVADKLQSDLVTLKFDDNQTNITFQLKTNEQLLKDAISEFVKSCNPSKVIMKSDDIQSVLFGQHNILDIISDRTKIIEAVNSSQVANAHTKILEELVADSIFVEKLHLRLQRNYFDIKNIQVQTTLGGKLLQNTSFGERCGIVIAIALVAGTNPIVVDQPEDNLDGKYISRVLVPLIRIQKQKRQIILVTRDANIAIGGDAELILILDSDGQRIKLHPATIENKSLRQKYIWVLDGGELAFQTREDKYSIPNKKGLGRAATN